ncbi:hypothetical protein AAE250_22335 [Bacteroides sp. GD17]|jgi:hypothetical protein|uniref:hypothetical protein n=1 Tax=Bacteroides sp. GD17 TaxID=3139826 RepID=UPI0025EF4AB7|nr:hypothetical protein [uncultured Bacteroides sp.]
MKTRAILPLLALALTFSACGSDDDDPNKTAQLTINVSGQPQNTYLEIGVTGTDGTDEAASGLILSVGTPTDVPEGQYAVTVFSLPHSLNDWPGSVSHQLATLKANPSITGLYSLVDGNITIDPTDDGQITDAPQVSSAQGAVHATSDSPTTTTLTLHPLTREVIVRGVVQMANPANLTSATATLYGVLNTRNLGNTFAGEATRATSAADIRAAAASDAGTYYVRAPFSLSDNGDGSFSVAFRLLGIDESASQRLVITLNGTDDSAHPYTYETDVTSLLSGFNSGPGSQPAQLTANLSFGLNDVTGTINGWTPGMDEDLEGK